MTSIIDGATTTTKFCIICRTLAFECDQTHEISHLRDQSKLSGGRDLSNSLNKQYIYIDITISLRLYLSLIESGKFSNQIKVVRQKKINFDDTFSNSLNKFKVLFANLPVEPGIYYWKNSDIPFVISFKNKILSYMKSDDLTDHEAREFSRFVATLREQEIDDIWEDVIKCKNKNNIILIHKYLGNRYLKFKSSSKSDPERIVALEEVDSIEKLNNDNIGRKNTSNKINTLISFLICCMLIFLLSLYLNIF